MNRPLIDLTVEGNNNINHINNNPNEFITETADPLLHSLMDEQIRILQLQIQEKIAEKHINFSGHSQYPVNSNYLNVNEEQNNFYDLDNDPENFKKLYKGIEDIKSVVSQETMINNSKKNDNARRVKQLEEELKQLNLQNDLKLNQNNFKTNQQTNLKKDIINSSQRTNNNTKLKKPLTNLTQQQQQNQHKPQKQSETNRINEQKGSTKNNRGAIPKHKIFFDHSALENIDLFPNKKQSNCSICYLVLNINQGAVIAMCLHTFCIKCLVKHIENSTEEKIFCPITMNNINCRTVLKFQLAGYKGVASKLKIFQNDGSNARHVEDDNDGNYEDEEEFEYLQTDNQTDQLKNEEFSLQNCDNIFRCVKPNCPGTGFVDFDDDKTTLVSCPVCNSYNCLLCKAIHPGMTCKEFAVTINNSKENDSWKCDVCSEINKLHYSKCKECNEPKSTPSSDDIDKWKCVHCTLINNTNLAICNACNKTNEYRLKSVENNAPANKSSIIQRFKSIFTNKSNKPDPPVNFWECNNCEFKNHNHENICRMCQHFNNLCGKCNCLLNLENAVTLDKCFHTFCKNCIRECFHFDNKTFSACPHLNCENIFQKIGNKYVAFN